MCECVYFVLLFIPMVQFIFCVVYIFICSHTRRFSVMFRILYLHVFNNTHSTIQLDNNIIHKAFFFARSRSFSLSLCGTNTSFDRLAHRIKKSLNFPPLSQNVTRLKIIVNMRNTRTKSAKCSIVQQWTQLTWASVEIKAMEEGEIRKTKRKWSASEKKRWQSRKKDEL